MVDEEGMQIWTRLKGTSIAKDNFAVKLRMTIELETSIPNLLRSLIMPEVRMQWDSSEYEEIKIVETDKEEPYLFLYYS